jgi:hypothetical protein
VIRSDGTYLTDPTVAMLRRWWRVRADLRGTLSTPAERLRATDLLQAFLGGP